MRCCSPDSATTPGKNNTDHWRKERTPLKTDDGVDLESPTLKDGDGGPRLSVPRGGQAKVEFDIPTSKLMLVNAAGNLTLYSVRFSRLALGGVLF